MAAFSVLANLSPKLTLFLQETLIVVVVEEGGFSHLPTNWLLARRYMDDDQDHGHVVNYSKWLSCLHYSYQNLDSHTKAQISTPADSLQFDTI